MLTPMEGAGQCNGQPLSSQTATCCKTLTCTRACMHTYIHSRGRTRTETYTHAHKEEEKAAGKSTHSCMVNLAPASMKGSLPEGNDSELWDETEGPNGASRLRILTG